MANMSEYGTPKCRCGLDAALKTASDGRKYFGCPRHVSSIRQCDFARMLPSSARESDLPTPTPSLSNLNQNRINQMELLPPLTQTQGKAKRDLLAMEGGDIASQTPSQKRTKVIEAALTASQESTNLAPCPSQRRTKIIQNVLAEFALSQSQNVGPKLGPAFSTPPPSLPNVLAEANFKELANGKDVRTVPEGEVVLSQQISPQVINTSKIDDCSSAYIDQQSGVPNTLAKSWVPQTPKRTEQDPLPSMFTGLTSPSPSPIQNTKGKQKVSDAPGDSSTRNCIKPCGSDQKLNIASESLSSPTKYSLANSKTQILRNLSGFFDYVSGLEKGHEVKDMKIKYLENEIQRLNDRQEELKKLLKLYEQQTSAPEQ